MPQTIEKKFEESLLALHLISPEQMELVRLESIKSGRSLDDVITGLKLVKEEDITRARAEALGYPYVDLTGKVLPQQILKKVPYAYARDYQSVSFADEPGAMSVAMVDPSNVRVMDFLEKKLGVKIKPFMASSTSLQHALNQYQKVAALEVGEALKKIEITESEKTEELDAKKMESMVADAPVTQAVNSILEFAAKFRASDIHIEPKENSVRVRYRIDGILHEEMEIPKHILPAIVSRIKILSNLKIDEHRIPQDGQFEVKFGATEIDVRVSVSPQVNGEKIVMRLLDKTSTAITLDQLGLKGRAYRILEEGIKKPNGMTLVTGPTGSGKTTTLNAVIKEINKEGINIITIEDPVEYKVEGVNQIQVNLGVGLTFAKALRSILRQDPDVIMVGEIRDEETAELAVHASLTGHVVLSTLHTNNSGGILPRLLNMNIEPYLIASVLRTGIGQRLVRKICPHCKESFEATAPAVLSITKSVGALLPNVSDTEEIVKEKNERLGLTELPNYSESSYTLYKGKGCGRCGESGYLGRMGIFEVFPMSPAIEQLLLKNPTASQVMNLAIQEGMVTMKQDGYLKALAGLTTLDEVVRVTSD